MPVIALHTSPETHELYCDGQGCFEILMRRKKRTTETAYWCSNMHGYFDPTIVTADNCPRVNGFKLPKPRWSGNDALWSR